MDLESMDLEYSMDLECSMDLENCMDLECSMDLENCMDLEYSMDFNSTDLEHKLGSYSKLGP